MTNVSNTTDECEHRTSLWGSEELDFWHRVVAVYMGVLPELERDLQRAGRLSFFEYQVLEHLSSVDGAMTMTQLATRCNSSLSRLSHVARKLEARKLLARRLSDQDKRVTVAELTEPGRKLVEGVRGVYRKTIETRVLRSLAPEELQEVTRLLDNMLRRNDPDHWLFSI